MLKDLTGILTINYKVNECQLDIEWKTISALTLMKRLCFHKHETWLCPLKNSKLEIAMVVIAKAIVVQLWLPERAPFSLKDHFNTQPRYKVYIFKV